MRTYTRTLFAALLCAALLCLPALAAEDADAPGAGAYEPNPQYTVIWGTVTRQENGSLLVQKSGASAPTDGYVLWTEHAAILDAVTGAPADAASIQNGSTVYAWVSAQSPMTMSLPPQTAPELLLVNVPADFHVPQYDIIVRSDGLTSLGIPERSGMAITLSDGSTLQVWEEATDSALPDPQPRYLSGSDPRHPGSGVDRCAGRGLQGSGLPQPVQGQRLSGQLWAPVYQQCCHAVALLLCGAPTGMSGSMRPSGRWRRPPGTAVSWDNALGAVVKDGGETVFSILPDSKALRGSCRSGCGRLPPLRSLPDCRRRHLSGNRRPCPAAGSLLRRISK